MVKKAITSYYDLLDQRIKEGTIIILLISFLIFSVGFLNHDGTYLKSSLGEYNTTPILSENSIVIIDGRKYKVILQEISK